MGGLLYRMDGVYRLLLHEKKVIQDDTSDAKLHAPIQYERDVATALGTTKWQVQTIKLSIFDHASPFIHVSELSASFWISSKTFIFLTLAVRAI